MRIRSIRPEFWSSEDVAAMSWDTRLVFIGLWSYVDDNGVGRDIERLITTTLFPLDEDLGECSVRVHRALLHLSEGGQISRYVVGGKPYLYINAWENNQRIERPSKERYPLPTSGNVENPVDSPNTHRILREPSPTGEGEKGRRGEGEKALKPLVNSVDRPDADFDAFWSAYPRKQAKAAARKAWDVAVKKVAPAVMVAGAVRYAADPNRDDAFTAHAATWLNAGRWDDEPLPARGNSGPPSRSQRAMTDAERLLQRAAEHDAANQRREIGA